MKRSVLTLLVLCCAAAAWAQDDHEHEHAAEAVQHTEPARQPADDQAHAAEDGGHDEHAGHDEHEPAGVSLDADQRRTIGLKSEPLQLRPVALAVEAPGEVQLNAYATAKVAPRIRAQILHRHARLGEQVRRGAPLVTLSSVEMATAQGELKVAHREWERARRLGQDVVTERRYTEARIAYELARAKVLAFGMTAAQVDALLAGEMTASGEFVLLAPRAGTVIADDFVEGDVVDSGRVLMTLTDESLLWVETRLTPKQAAAVAVGNVARVETPAGWVEGKVVQLRHQVDPATRTLDARIALPNPDDRLHAGEFVVVQLHSALQEQALTLPQNAIQRSPDGDWQVFVEEEPGHYLPQEVELVRTVGGHAVVDGLAPGTPVVTHGAFFLQSELAKGGFEVHQH